MMEKDVPIRKLTGQYRSDDGRRVEVYEKCGVVVTTFPDDVDPESVDFEESDEEITYFGVLRFAFGDAGEVNDLRFDIPGAISVEDAFVKFNDISSVFIQNLRKDIEQQQNQVVAAPEGALDVIDSLSNEFSDREPGGDIVVP